MYKIIFDEGANKQLEKFNEFVRKRILRKIIELKDNPYSKIKRLKNRDEFSLRVGDYRVLLDIKKDLIRILNIGHRKNIYDR
jgi:mRNA interferase RelE/StbE